MNLAAEIGMAAGGAMMHFNNSTRRVPYLILTAQDDPSEQVHTLCISPAFSVDEGLLMGGFIAEDIAGGACAYALKRFPQSCQYAGVALAMRVQAVHRDYTAQNVAETDQLLAAYKAGNQAPLRAEAKSVTALLWIGPNGATQAFTKLPGVGVLPVVSLLSFEGELALLGEINRRFMAVA